jgi:Big-like domain-containing protein
VGHDTVNVLVVASPPTAHITNPRDGSTFGTDQTITFTGNAHDPQDRELGGAQLHWKVFRGPTLVADLGTGSSISDRITTQGTYTVQLTATDAERLTSSPASITVVIGPAAGNPSATIDDPLSGSSFYGGSCTSTLNVSFRGHATDPTDGTLSGGQLAWYLDYGTAQQMRLGTGNSFTAPIPQSCNFQQTYTITLVATDSRGHQSTYTITITTGAPG